MNSFYKEKRFCKAISGAFLACLVFSVICFQYYNYLRETIQEESSHYLQEISRQIGINVNRVIEDHYTLLDTMATFIKDNNANSINDLHTYMDMQKKYGHFQNVILIDSNGLGHRINGQTISLSGDMYLRDTLLNKEKSLSTLQTIDNQKTVILAVPIENVIMDNTNMVALAVSLETKAFEKLLSMTSFDEKAYSHIFTKKGNPIISATSPNVLNMSDNLFNTIQGSKIDDNSDFSEMKKDIKDNHSGHIVFTLEGVPMYMAYNPIEYKDWYLATFVPVSVASGKSDHLLKITLLICSGISFVFFTLMLILILFYRRHRLELENIAYVDPITGGNTISGFYRLAKEVLTISKNREQYAFIYINIRNFKLLNEQFGRNHCDDLLHALYESINDNLSDKEVVGRVIADNFCVLLEFQNTQKLLTRFNQWYVNIKENVEKHIVSQSMHPELEFGVYVIENNTVSFEQMFTRAKLALCEAIPVHNTRFRYALYDDKLRRQLLREKRIEAMMEDALKKGEFQVYLQPKYSLPNERIGGAEALTRWISESEGMIYPDEFIPLFEKNGFIIQLDLWIFEEVCRLIRIWLDEERELIKVSINCSRIHFKKPDFFKEYVKIAKSYNVPSNLIEIELTESLFLEDIHHFIRIIEEIRKAGFGCSIDDFGSGYSSLNLIKDITVDTLKLDKVFFHNLTQDNKRAEYVISSIISMAKALSMKTVAEGVEEREQVEMLKRLGCDYIQGYVYTKPLPVKEFEQLL